MAKSYIEVRDVNINAKAREGRIETAMANVSIAVGIGVVFIVRQNVLPV